MGINLPRQEESGGIARKFRGEKVQRWELPEDPGKSPQSHALPRGSETARGATAKQEGERRGGGEHAFKPGLPSEGADNKEAAKVWEARGGGGVGG